MSSGAEGLSVEPAGPSVASPLSLAMVASRASIRESSLLDTRSHAAVERQSIARAIDEHRKARLRTVSPPKEPGPIGLELNPCRS